MTNIRSRANALVPMLLLATVACGGGSEAQEGQSSIALDSSSSVSANPNASMAAEVGLSRESLVALEECVSDSSFAYTWALDVIFIDQLEQVAETCEEASTQLRVDQQMGADWQTVQEHLVVISSWILTIRREITNLSIGLEGNLSKMLQESTALEESTDEFIKSFDK